MAVALLVNVPSPDVTHEIVPLLAEYPAKVYDPDVTQAVADDVPEVATGAGVMVRAKVVVAVQPPLLTVIVSVFVPPTDLSTVPKV